MPNSFNITALGTTAVFQSFDYSISWLSGFGKPYIQSRRDFATSSSNVQFLMDFAFWVQLLNRQPGEDWGKNFPSTEGAPFLRFICAFLIHGGFHSLWVFSCAKSGTWPYVTNGETAKQRCRVVFFCKNLSVSGWARWERLFFSPGLRLFWGGVQATAVGWLLRYSHSLKY